MAPKRAGAPAPKSSPTKKARAATAAPESSPTKISPVKKVPEPQPKKVKKAPKAEVVESAQASAPAPEVVEVPKKAKKAPKAEVVESVEAVAPAPEAVEVPKKDKIGPEAPILACLAAEAGLPKPCMEMLQLSLPRCLKAVASERHSFETRILEFVTSVFIDIESKRREAIAKEQAELSSVQAEQETSAADLEKKRTIASERKGECDLKAKAVEAASAAVQEANEAHTAAQQAQEDFVAHKEKLYGDQEGFAKFVADVYQPLKDGAFASKDWRKRNQSIAEVQIKVTDLGLEESLRDALGATLKIKPMDREEFAKGVLEYAERFFEEHKQKVSEEIASLDATAAAHAEAVTVAKSSLEEKQGELQALEKAWDEMQNEWVTLEDGCAEATRIVQGFEIKLPEITKRIAKATAELEKFLEMPALLSSLKDPSDLAAEAADSAKADIVVTDACHDAVTDGGECAPVEGVGPAPTGAAGEHLVKSAEKVRVHEGLYDMGVPSEAPLGA